MLKTISLNKNWFFKSDFDKKYISATCDLDAFLPVELPHSISTTCLNYIDKVAVEKKATYKTKVTIAEKFLNKNFVLRFEAIYFSAEIYINHVLAFSHKGGFTPFWQDVTAFVHPGVNDITVVVDSTKNELMPHQTTVDDAFFGGIYREAQLFVYEDEYFENIKITPINILGDLPELQVEVWFNTKLSTGQKIEIDVFSPNGDIFIKFNEAIEIVDYKCYNIPLDAKFKLWDLDNPIFYTLTASINKESITTKFAFRQAEFKKSGFYLNGIKTKLIGAERKQCYPYIGYAMPKAGQEEDACKLKELGLNFVLASAPPCKHFLDACDDLGVLVYIQLPAQKFISATSGWQQLLFDNIKELIDSCYHHPSIVLWGTWPKNTLQNADLVKRLTFFVKNYDKSRQTGGNRSFAGVKICENVLCLENYSDRKFIKFMPEFALRMGNPFVWGGKTEKPLPEVVTAHNYKSLFYSLFSLNKAFATNRTCGYICGTLTDYYSQYGYGQEDGINRCGYLNIFRQEKPACALLKMQNLDTYFLQAFIINPSKILVLSNCNDVKLAFGNKPLVVLKPKKLLFKNLAHLPIVVNDIIGTRLVDEEKLGKFASGVVKHALRKAAKNLGSNVLMSVGLIPRLYLRAKKFTQNQLNTFYDKYIIEPLTTGLTLNGSFNNNPVALPVEWKCGKHLQLSVDKKTIVKNQTYNTAKIDIMAITEKGSRLYNCFDVVDVNVSDSLEIIGPTQLPLINGATAFWVKNKTDKGSGKVSVTSQFDTKTINLEIINEEKK